MIKLSSFFTDQIQQHISFETSMSKTRCQQNILKNLQNMEQKFWRLKQKKDRNLDDLVYDHLEIIDYLKWQLFILNFFIDLFYLRDIYLYLKIFLAGFWECFYRFLSCFCRSLLLYHNLDQHTYMMQYHNESVN